jgi:hypothetical protein
MYFYSILQANDYDVWESVNQSLSIKQLSLKAQNNFELRLKT